MKKERKDLTKRLIMAGIVSILIFWVISDDTTLIYCNYIPDCLEYEDSSYIDQVYIEECGCENPTEDFRLKNIFQRFWRNLDEINENR